MLVSAVTGSERTLAPGVDVVVEVVRMAVNERFPSLMPTLYPGSMAMGPKPYASLDKMWKEFGDLFERSEFLIDTSQKKSLQRVNSATAPASVYDRSLCPQCLLVRFS